MQVLILILILLLALIVFRQGIKLRHMEEKTCGAFKLICDKIRTNEARMNAYISQLMHEEDAE